MHTHSFRNWHGSCVIEKHKTQDRDNPGFTADVVGIISHTLCTTHGAHHTGHITRGTRPDTRCRVLSWKMKDLGINKLSEILNKYAIKNLLLLVNM